jgi:hypothetical protein
MKNIKQLKENFSGKPEAGLLICTIDGENSKTLASFYQNIATDLFFPEHFGANLDAFYDMLCDLTWLEDKGIEKLHLVVRNYDALLVEEDNEQKLGILSVIRDSAEEWYWLEKEESFLDFGVFIEPSKTFKKDLKEI